MGHPSRRLPVPPPLLSSPRSSLDKISYAFIDSALKSLKACSRRLQNVLSIHQAELQVLNRLYYKGKNQHRSALFWKHVGEIRRYASRLDAMGMLNTVESVRYSFFDEAAKQNPKLLKGPWTHIPCASYICHVVERLSACYVLVEKMHGRLVEAYRSLTLAMQSGAFIQLVLTLTAIVSRMYTLVPEIQDILALGWTACHCSLQVLSPSCAMKLKPIGPRIDAEGRKTPVGQQSTPNPYEFDDATYEDLGSSTARLTQVPSITQEVHVNAAGPGLPSGGLEDTVAALANMFAPAEDGVQWPSQSTVPQSISTVAFFDDEEADKLSTTTASTKRAHKSRPNVIVPQIVKKKRDEIDDIFGF